MFFDERKKQGGGFVGHMSDGGDVKDDYAGGEDEILETVAEDLVTAVHAKDVKGVAEALKAFLACVQALDAEQDGQEA